MSRKKIILLGAAACLVVLLGVRALFFGEPTARDAAAQLVGRSTGPAAQQAPQVAERQAPTRRTDRERLQASELQAATDEEPASEPERKRRRPTRTRNRTTGARTAETSDDAEATPDSGRIRPAGKAVRRP